MPLDTNGAELRPILCHDGCKTQKMAAMKVEKLTNKNILLGAAIYTQHCFSMPPATGGAKNGYILDNNSNM